MTPGNLGPKTIKLSKIMKINVFFQHGKAAHRDSEKGALNERQLQIIDVELLGANSVFEKI